MMELDRFLQIADLVKQGICSESGSPSDCNTDPTKVVAILVLCDFNGGMFAAWFNREVGAEDLFWYEGPKALVCANSRVVDATSLVAGMHHLYGAQRVCEEIVEL